MLTLDEYDINFVDAANYEIYNHQTGALVSSGAYAAGNPINFEGIEVVINGAPAADDSFFVSPLSGAIENLNVAVTDTQKVAAASSDLNLPGDNANALQIAQLPQTFISDINGATFESYYRGLVSNVGTVSKAAKDSVAYDENLLFELEMRREEVSGVSLDEEAANLIRYQRAFEAGARILKVTDELLEMVINL
jgi:flagellar hook-associated protein 1 FlgK